jgi:hypothetical protein
MKVTDGRIVVPVHRFKVGIIVLPLLMNYSWECNGMTGKVSS